MTRFIVVTLFTILPLVVRSGAAQESSEDHLPVEVSALQFEYEVMVEEIRKPIATLDGQYVKRLDSIRSSLQQAGDLDGILAVDKEKEAIQTSGLPLTEVPENEPSDLSEARKIYLRTRQSMEGDLRGKIDAEKRRYIGGLKKYTDQYTREGKLDLAVRLEELSRAAEQAGSDFRIATEKSNSFSSSSSGSLQIKVQVDGTSHLMLRGDRIWYDHSEGTWAKPGQKDGENPTFLNGETEWMPTWIDKKTRTFESGIELPTSGDGVELSIQKISGRGFARVDEQPTSENNFTAKIGLLDETPEGKPFLGHDWLEFEITW